MSDSLRSILISFASLFFFWASPAAAETLRFMHWQDGMTAKSAWWADIVSRFEAKHPGVTVETNQVTFAQYLPTLEAMIAGNNLPDVFLVTTRP